MPTRPVADGDGAVRPASGRTLLRGLARRCPRCGGGRLFRRWLQMAERCPRCGLRFQRVPGHWAGAYFLNLVLTQTVFMAVLVALLVATWPSPPYGWIMAAGIAVAVLVPLVAHPTSKTMWSAIDLLLRPLDLDEVLDAAPHGDDDLAALLDDAEVDAERARSRRRR